MLEKDKNMGHILLESLKERPDSICQIDAATGEEETNASARRRSICLARCLRRLGLVPGDVLALCGNNHLDQQIPCFAAHMNGLTITGVDPMFKIDEIKDIFKVVKPKIAFCEPESYNEYAKASKDLGLVTMVYTFGKGEHSMKELLETYQDDTPIEEFEVATFDKDKIYTWLFSSGGTTGVVKLAAIKHDAWMTNINKLLVTLFGTSDRKDQPHKRALNLSSIHWASGLCQAVSMPVLHQTKVQTSAPATTEHVIDIINKYRPVTALMGPSLVSRILNNEKHCDMTCFETLLVTGGKVYKDMLLGLKEKLNENSTLIEMYGQTESLGPVLAPNPLGPIGNCGRPYPSVQVKLIDPETGREITEPYVTGEMWTKGKGFSCYYNNPEETARAFTEDGWYKTGDLLYHDENDNYFFVERLSMLIKYRNYLIMPLKLEEVIRSHPGVLDVSVTSIPHREDGEHPVACVVTHPGCTVTAIEIKDLVASKLSETNKLRGGVVFLKELPMTHAGKVARGKLCKLVTTVLRE